VSSDRSGQTPHALYFPANSAGLESLPRIVEHVASILGWDGKRQADELSAVAAEFRADMQACADPGMFVPKLHQETVCA